MFQPVRIEKTADREILIEWDDGETQKIPFRTLRNGCQCAACTKEKSAPEETATTGGGLAGGGSLPVLTAEQARPLDVIEMTPAGNYAYNIRFSDGHATGIFTLELLRALGG